MYSKLPVFFLPRVELGLALNESVSSTVMIGLPILLSLLVIMFDEPEWSKLVSFEKFTLALYFS